MSPDELRSRTPPAVKQANGCARPRRKEVWRPPRQPEANRASHRRELRIQATSLILCRVASRGRWDPFKQAPSALVPQTWRSPWLTKTPSTSPRRGENRPDFAPANDRPGVAFASEDESYQAHRQRNGGHHSSDQAYRFVLGVAHPRQQLASPLRPRRINGAKQLQTLGCV